jgi:hypothetical protein
MLTIRKSCVVGSSLSAMRVPGTSRSLMAQPRRSLIASDCGVPLAFENRTQASKLRGCANTPTRSGSGSLSSTVNVACSSAVCLGCASRLVEPTA